MRGTDGGRGDTIPLRSPPARCQVPEDFLECSTTVNGEEAGDVLGEEPSGATLDGDPPDLGPEPSLVVGSEPLPGDAGSLAGESGSDEIHSAAQRSAVEGLQIVPYRGWSQGASFHLMSEDGSSVGLPLDSSHKAKSGASDSSGALEAAVPGAEGEDSSGTNNHKIPS